MVMCCLLGDVADRQVVCECECEDTLPDFVFGCVCSPLNDTAPTNTPRHHPIYRSTNFLKFCELYPAAHNRRQHKNARNLSR